MQLTVSFKKGKSGESSIYHNNRSIEKKFDYDKKGHEHIRRDETKNNVVLIHKNLNDIYDEYFDEKALQAREDAVAQREKFVESNENSFRKLFHQFKENYMLAGLEDLDDNFKRQNDIYEIANNWADINSNSKRAKNAEKAVFDNHPKRKIKAFLTAITSVFGRVNNIDTALDNQQDVIDEQKVDQSKRQKQQKQDIDIDDDN